MEDTFRVIVPAYLRKVTDFSEKHPNLKSELDRLSEGFWRVSFEINRPLFRGEQL
jgi:hypothetical protein